MNSKDDYSFKSVNNWDFNKRYENYTYNQDIKEIDKKLEQTEAILNDFINDFGLQEDVDINQNPEIIALKKRKESIKDKYKKTSENGHKKAVNNQHNKIVKDSRNSSLRNNEVNSKKKSILYRNRRSVLSKRTDTVQNNNNNYMDGYVESFEKEYYASRVKKIPGIGKFVDKTYAKNKESVLYKLTLRLLIGISTIIDWVDNAVKTIKLMFAKNAIKLSKHTCSFFYYSFSIIAMIIIIMAIKSKTTWMQEKITNIRNLSIAITKDDKGQTDESETKEDIASFEILIATKDANIRSGPGTSHDIIGTVKKGEEVLTFGEVKIAENGKEWYDATPFENQSITGWISSSLVEKQAH